MVCITLLFVCVCLSPLLAVLVLVDSSLVGYIPVCHASKSSMQQLAIFTHSFTVLVLLPWPYSLLCHEIVTKGCDTVYYKY